MGSLFWQVNSSKADQSWVTTQINNKKTFGSISATGFSVTGDINIRTISEYNDSPDIVWFYKNGQEKARIWLDPNEYTTKIGPKFRMYKTDGTQIYSGNLALT